MCRNELLGSRGRPFAFFSCTPLAPLSPSFLPEVFPLHHRSMAGSTLQPTAPGIGEVPTRCCMRRAGPVFPNLLPPLHDRPLRDPHPCTPPNSILPIPALQRRSANIGKHVELRWRLSYLVMIIQPVPRSPPVRRRRKPARSHPTVSHRVPLTGWLPSPSPHTSAAMRISVRTHSPGNPELEAGPHWPRNPGRASTARRSHHVTAA